MKPAVFLDRDGTMIEDVGYLDSLERVDFYPVDGRRHPHAQPRRPRRSWSSRTSRGSRAASSTKRSSSETHRSIDARLAAGGARIDAYYYCPHHPDGKVAGVRATLRLPQAGPRHDRPRRARARSRSGALLHGRRQLARHRARPRASARAAFWCAPATAPTRSAHRPPASTADAVVDNLAAAVWILRNSETRTEALN